MATYVNDLRLKEITPGDEDGTWGGSTNTNWFVVAEAWSYGTIQVAADANETFTIPDGTTSALRSFALDVTSAVALTATRTLTFAPASVSKVWLVNNATTGDQSIIIKQGSGATVTIPNGSAKMIATDGAGASGAVIDVLDDAAGVTTAIFGVEHETSDGKHKYVTMAVQVSAPTVGANRGALYPKDVNGIAELFYKDENDNEIQFTSNGELNVDIPSTVLAPSSLNADGAVTAGTSVSSTTTMAAGTTFTAGTSVSAPIYKAASAAVNISGGDYTFNLDVATVFRANVTASGTVTLTCTDATKAYSFTIIATTSGAYNFTSLTMAGVTIYKKLDTTINLQASGRTVLGCIYDGAAATLDVFLVEMAAV
jgi:hypothetical protein